MTPEICLAIALFFEGRSESIDGQIAIGKVIMNRVESEKYPDSVCEVINQPYQFSFTHDGKSDDPTKYDTYYDEIAWEIAQDVAKELINNKVDIDITSTHYHTLDVSPSWKDKLQRDGKIGHHLFYTE